MSGTVNAWRAASGELFAWWVQELRDARVSAAELFAPVKSPCFHLQLATDHGVLSRVGDATGERRAFRIEQGRIPPLEDVWAGEKPISARLEVVLPEAHVLAFALKIPPISEHAFKAAVQLQLERKLPLPREQLYVDWVVTEKLADRSRIVSVAAARRTHVDQWCERLCEWHWRIVRVAARDADGTMRFNLLPRREHPVSFTMGRREVWLGCSALALVVCYGLVTASHWLYERVSLRASVADARIEVAKVRQLQAALEGEAAPLLALKQLAQSPTAGSALSALSVALPKDSWLYQAEIHAAAWVAPVLSVEGYAPSASSLVQALEQVRQFDNIQLIESSIGDTLSTQSRIKLKAQLRRSGQP